MKSKRMERQMNKEQSADDPSVDLIRVKNMLNSTISWLPDVVIACIEHKVSATYSTIGGVDDTICMWRIIPWWCNDPP